MNSTEKMDQLNKKLADDAQDLQEIKAMVQELRAAVQGILTRMDEEDAARAQDFR